MLRNDFTLTKRHLGLLLLLVGVAGFLGILAIDILDVGREGGIGPAQQIALGLMIALALTGLTLIPLGNDPA
jgi:predicted MFS family arabinose efflux permease